MMLPYYIPKRSASTLRRRRILRRAVLWIVGILVCLGAAWWGTFASGRFLVNEIAVTGTRTVEVDAVRMAVERALAGELWRLFPRRSIFLIHPDRVGDAIRTAVPEVVAVQVTLQRNERRLVVAVTERVFAGVWCPPATSPASPCLLMDTTGVLYGESPSASGSLVLVMRGARPLGIGQEALAPEALRMLQEAKLRMEREAGVGIRELNLAEYPDVSAGTAEGWALRFDASRSLDATVAALRRTLDHVGADRARLEYLDLRVDGRAYFVRRNADPSAVPSVLPVASPNLP